MGGDMSREAGQELVIHQKEMAIMGFAEVLGSIFKILKNIRSIKKDNAVTYQDWDLTNHAGIPIAGGIYLIHVEVPNVGERVLKAFIAMRMVDLQNI